MPSWVTDDDKWEKAKKAAAEQGRAGDYAYVTGIYKQMGGKIRKQTMKAEIDNLRDLLKARDVSKLTKKSITNKLGHKTTVYVRAGEKPVGDDTKGFKLQNDSDVVRFQSKYKDQSHEQLSKRYTELQSNLPDSKTRVMDIKEQAAILNLLGNPGDKVLPSASKDVKGGIKDQNIFSVKKPSAWTANYLREIVQTGKVPGGSGNTVTEADRKAAKDELDKRNKKAGTVDYTPDKKNPFKQFEELARKHSQTDAFRAVGNIKNVPREVAKQFRNEYGQGGGLSMSDAWGNFYQQVAGNKDSMASIKMVDKSERKDNEGNAMTSWQYQLADGTKLQVSNAVYGGQRRWRVQSSVHDRVLVAPDKQHGTPQSAIESYLKDKGTVKSTDIGSVMNQKAANDSKPKSAKRFTESDFTDKTSLLPDVIAETVANERDKDDAFTKKFQTYVKERMLAAYNANPEFRKKLNGAKGRDVAYTFVRHWLDHVEKRGFTPGAPAGSSTMKAQTDNLRALLKASPLVKAEEVKAVEPASGKMGEALRDCDKAFIKSLGSIATALGDSTKERLRNLVQYDLRWQTNAQDVMNRVDAAYMFETGKEIPEDMRKTLVAATNAIVTQNAQDRNQRSQVSEEKVTYQPTLAKAAVDPQWRGLLSVDRVSV